MRQYSIHIDPIKLSKLLTVTFERLPKEYFKAFESFLKFPSKSYLRESLISKWIAIPVSSNIIFKNFDQPFRLENILVSTVHGTTIELQIYLTNNGIIGVSLADDFENLIIDKVDISNFRINQVPISNFVTGNADLEYLTDFDEIDEYLDNKYSSDVYSINGEKYYTIITCTDETCIVLNDKKAVFHLNKKSGLTKQLSKHPKEFITAFKNGEFIWIFGH